MKQKHSLPAVPLILAFILIPSVAATPGSAVVHVPAGVVPPSDESHATKPIGICGTRHFDPRLELCDSRNDRLYRFTIVGNQTWMAENLDYGSMIPGSRDQTKPDQKYCLNDRAAHCGALYQWAEAMALQPDYNKRPASVKGPHQGICPHGWHLPTSADWQQLLGIVRKEQGDQSEAVSLMTYSADDAFRWKSNTTPDDMLPIHDRYGMAIIPEGHRVAKGTCPDGPPTDSFFCNAHDMAKFWTSEENPTDPSVGVSITVIEDLPHVVDSSKSIFDALTVEEKRKWFSLADRKRAEQSELQRSYKVADKTQGMSVRCLRD